MAGAAIPLMLGGTILSASGQLQAGNAAAQLGAAQQQAYNVQAGQVQAEGTSEARNQQLTTNYVISAARARAVAYGASGTAPTPINVEGQLAARGSYNMLSDLYMANEKSQALQYQGTLANYAGQIKQQAGQIGAMSSILTGAGTLATRYGKPGGASGNTPGETGDGSGGFY